MFPKVTYVAKSGKITIQEQELLTEAQFHYWQAQVDTAQSLNAFYYYCTEWEDEKQNLVEDAENFTEAEFIGSLPTLPDDLAKQLYQEAREWRTLGFDADLWARRLRPHIGGLALEIASITIWWTVTVSDNWIEYQEAFGNK